MCSVPIQLRHACQLKNELKASITVNTTESVQVLTIISIGDGIRGWSG